MATKKVKKFVRPVVKLDENSPVEVLVYDCIRHARVVAEYRNESKWWFGTRMFKVFHPGFTETPDHSRWVIKLGRILGAFNPQYIPSLKVERAVIRQLMA